MLENVGIKDLQLARLIVETGSLTSAAERMHVSQPAVSQRLRQLQQRTGTELFERVDGRLQPTASGRRLAEAAISVARVLEAASADLRNIAAHRRRHIRISTQCYTCYRWLPFVIRDLRAREQGLVVDVVPEATDDPYGALAAGYIDVALVNNPRIGTSYRHVDLFEDELYAVMHDDHALAKQRFVTPADLAAETLVLYTGNKHAVVEEVMRPAGALPGRIVQVRITEAIIELARAGEGIAVLSGWAFDDIDNREQLAAVRITRGGFKRTWRAAVRPECDEAFVAAFIDSVGAIGRCIHQESWRKELQRGATT